jgi:hypothetical protein
MTRAWKEEFKQAQELRAGPGLEDGVWRVCEDYRLIEPKGQPAYIKPRYPVTRADKWRTIYPLDGEDMFVQFVNVHERGFAEAHKRALAQGDKQGNYSMRTFDYWKVVRDEWAKRYGLLGLGGSAWLGGRSETIQGYMAETIRAAKVLYLYEAILDEDEEAASTLLEQFPWKVIDGERLGDDGWYRMPPLEHAFYEVKLEVEKQVQEHCRATLMQPKGWYDISKVKSGWAFDSLLGPMYLQMYWHVAAQRTFKRCKQCGDLIQNPRANQDFCRSRDGVRNKCRNDWNYHMGEGESNKHIRKAKREADKRRDTG